MQMEFRSEDDHETPGWISVADTMMLGVIMFVGLAVTSAGDLNDANERVSAIKEEVKNTQKKLAKVTILLDAKTERISILEKDKDSLKATIRELEQEIVDLKKEIADLKSQIPTVSIETTIAKLEAMVEMLTNAKLDLETRNKGLTAALDDEKKTVANLKAEKASLTDLVASVKKMLETVTAQLAARKKELDETKTDLANAKKDTEKAKADLVAANKELEEVQKKLVEAQAEIAKLKEKIGDPLKREKELQLELADALSMLKGLKEKLATAIKDKKELLAANADLTKELEQLRGKFDQFQTEYTELKDKNVKLTGLLDAQKERILKPLETAGLVVRLSARNLPEKYDLDLYVQDPDDRLCYWKLPRILSETSQVATLVPSESLRIANLVNDNKKETFTEEAFYAKKPDPGKPYLLFCMIRKIGEFKASEDIEQRVDWKITYRMANGETDELVGNTIMKKSGAIMVGEKGETYPGLTAVGGFRIVDSRRLRLAKLADSDVPQLPRGWVTKSFKGSDRAFQKFDEVNRQK